MEEPLPLPAGPLKPARFLAEAWDAFARRDLEAFRGFVTDDVEFHGTLGRIDAATHTAVDWGHIDLQLTSVPRDLADRLEA